MQNKTFAFFAAAATLTFAGAALAQTAPTQTPPAQTPSTHTEQVPAAAQPSADAAAAAPASAKVAADYAVGAEIHDPSGVVVGTVSGTSAAADGSTNVVVSNGGVKFALPAASLSTKAGVISTTATKAQIDATLAGAKPQ